MENHAKYGDAIYFHNADTLWVNLFIALNSIGSRKGLRLTENSLSGCGQNKLVIQNSEAGFSGLAPALSRLGN